MSGLGRYAGDRDGRVIGCRISGSESRFRVQASGFWGFGVQDFRFRTRCPAFRVPCFGFRVSGFGLGGYAGSRDGGVVAHARVLGDELDPRYYPDVPRTNLGFRVSGLRFRVLGFGFRVQSSGFRVQDSGSRGFRVQGFGFRISGSWFRIPGFGLGGVRRKQRRLSDRARQSSRG